MSSRLTAKADLRDFDLLNKRELYPLANNQLYYYDPFNETHADYRRKKNLLRPIATIKSKKTSNNYHNIFYTIMGIVALIVLYTNFNI